MLSDLTFIEDGNSDNTVDNLINWQKRSLLAKILTDFTHLQNCCKYAQIKPTELRKG